MPLGKKKRILATTQPPDTLVWKTSRYVDAADQYDFLEKAYHDCLDIVRDF